MKGRYGFDISLDTAHPQYSKTPHSAYSKITQRMYIKKDADIPLSFTVQSFEGLQRCRLVITAVHKQPEMVAENLQCCIKHVEEQKRNGVHHPYHFVRSQMDGCAFFGNPVAPDQRLFIALPFSNLQRSGDSLFTALLKFPCFTSDFKRAGQLVQLIFRVELERELLGRAVLDVRVCASPGRDMSADERRGKEGGSGEDSQRRRRGRKRAAPVKEEVEQTTFPPRKVTKVTKTKEEYTIKTFPEIFPHVLEAVKLLERVFTVPLILPDDPDSPTNTEPPQLHRHGSASSMESWLEGLGLAHHIPLFHQKGIRQTFQALSVTDNELKLWGVGDRDRQTILEGMTILQERSSSLPSSSLHTLSQAYSQGSSASGTQPFPPFEVIQIQARKKTIRPPH
ncbi:Cellular tumor antigen p53 [Geodia barretti]|nr:Cellular tumor antigen p53 [Geodia barretti]